MTNSLVPNSKSGRPVPVPSLEGAVDTYYAQEREPGAGQLTRIFAALRRFTWLIVLITIVGSVLSVLATRFIKPTYVVGTTLYLQNTKQPGNGPIAAPEIVSSYNWVELSRTFAVLDTVVREVKLYLRPMGKVSTNFFEGFELASRYQPGEYRLRVDEQGKRYALLLANGVELTGGPVTDSVGKAAGFLWRPGPGKLPKKLDVRFRVLTLRDAAADLRNRLRASLNAEAGSFLLVSLSGTNPTEIAATINSFQRQFVAVAADLKKVKLRELSNVLQDQLRQQETKLRDAEGALESFKVATVTQPREDVAIASGISVTQNTAYSRYFAQRIDLENIRTDREAIESALTRLVAGETTVDAFSTIPAARNSRDLNRVLEELSASQAELRALRQKYTDEFKGVKDVQDKIQTLTRSTIPAYAQALAQSLKIQERELLTRNNAAGVELRNIPIRAITEARLQRDMESARNLTLNLQNRYEENKLAELSAIPDVSILDEARVPTSPIGNEAPRIIMLGVFASLGVGLGLAVLLDRMDKRFRYPEQASSELGLSILGAIPAIPKARNGKKVDHTEMHQVIEAFRSVRLNLAHSFGPEEPICLTISSPSPGDGKSLVAANLALSFAEGGYRTLLIDGDIRRGDLHRTFGAERRPGLLDYLGSAQLPLERVYRQTSHERLTLIPCGTRLQYGPELLSSARMAELIAKLRDKFEVIVADSPPLGAGVDPFLLGTHLGNILLVLRTGETDREMAEAKLRMLERLPIKILGAVLNHIKAGVGPYKYYSYSYGYAAENEISEEPEKEVLTRGA